MVSEGMIGDITSLRAYKKARTRAAIEDAAVQLFREKGFDETTIADIAKEVVISPRTFFRYFTSKEDVLLARERELLRMVGAQLAARPRYEPLRESLLAVLLPLAATYEDICDDMLPRMEIIIANPALLGEKLLMMGSVEQMFCDVLAERMGLDPDSQRMRLLAAVIVAAFRIAGETWMETDGHRSLPDLLQENFDLLAGGLLR